MKLYYSPGACSLAPHIVAREAEVPIELEKVDLKSKTTASGKDYKAINPKGYVPALQLDEGLLTENAAILQYLGDRNPSAGLLPAAGKLERYRAVEWLTFISTEVHKGYGPLFDPSLPDDMKQKTKDKLATRLALVDKALAGKRFLMGDQFTAPDAYLFTVVNWSKMTGVDLAPFANVQEFQKRVAARPKVQEAMKAEGLIK
jgi:glutathione S-transferase